MKVTLELGKAIGFAQACWKAHDFELRVVSRTLINDYEVYFCRRCGAKVRIR